MVISNHFPSKDLVRAIETTNWKWLAIRFQVYGCFLKWWFPQNTPKRSFFVGKPIVVGYHHFRKPLSFSLSLSLSISLSIYIYIYVYLEHPQWIADLSFFCMHGPLSVCDLWASLPSGPGRELQDAYCRRGGKLEVWHHLFLPLLGEMLQFDECFSNGLKPLISDI